MSKSVKVYFLGAAALAATVVVGAVIPGVAQAQVAPPGYILDVGAVNNYGPTTWKYTQFTTTFTAALADTTVAWLFREDPSYFSFDDASVSLTSGGPNLLVDPGFENAMIGSSKPAGWTEFVQPSVPYAQGVVVSGSPTGFGIDPSSGSNYWLDGSLGGYDGLAQTVATTIGDQYTVSFYLADTSVNFYQVPNLDVFVYAGSGVPGVPEPASWAMMLIGFAGLGAAMRSRRKQAAATA